MPTTTQTHGSATKKSPRPSPARPALDDTQQALIAKLESRRESWQTSGRYKPERPQEHPTTRRAAGAQILQSVPHAAHAEWTPPKHRPNPVDLVVAGNAGRQEHLVPLRMGRMAASPFAFLRGAAAVMAWDLSHTPVTDIQVAINGDAHINNFGLYGTPQRDVVVDLNDFDEAGIGPWEWDLKRLVASVNVAGRENGINRKERRRAVMKAVAGYRFNMTRVSAMGVLEVWSIYGYAERRPTVVKVPNRRGRSFRRRWARRSGRRMRPCCRRLPTAARTAGGGSRRTRPSSRVWTMTRAARSSRRLSSTPSISRRPTGPCCNGIRSPTWSTAWSASGASAPTPIWRCALVTGTLTRSSSR